MFGRLIMERGTIREIDRIVARIAAKFGLNRRSGPWRTRIFRQGDESHVECTVTVHRYDPHHLLASHLRGRVRARMADDHSITPVFAVVLAWRFRMLRRCRIFETRLRAAGLDTACPPASAYRTDLITRLLLGAWDIDARVLVADAPHPIRSRRWTISPSAAESWYGYDARSIIPAESGTLPADFPPMVCDFDVDFLQTRSISLGKGVRVEPCGRGGSADIFIPQRLPMTAMTAAPGLPLGAFVAHDALVDPALEIVAARDCPTGTVLTVQDPVVALFEPSTLLGGPIGRRG